MGSGMARRLLGAGFPLTVYNRDPEARDDAGGGRGARRASPREAAARADVILSMVADDDASRAVWLGEHGALAARPRHRADRMQHAHGRVDRGTGGRGGRRGCELLDAPVTGSKVHAASGELNFLVGGQAAALERRGRCSLR